MLEKGRHLNIEKNQRFCPFFPSQIETEKHFMLECKAYTPIRNCLLRTICAIQPQFIMLTEHEKFVSLLSDEKFIPGIAPYIFNAFQIRTFLNNKHKNNV